MPAATARRARGAPAGTARRAPEASQGREPRDVWSALANPVRRDLLDQLRDAPRTTGELAAAVPRLSRFAVMQHLSVLEEAGLVVVRRRGRNRLNHLNPTPLEEVRQRWLNRFSEEAGRVAVALGRHLATATEPGGTTDTPNDTEETMTTTTNPTATARSVRIESELRVRARRQRVFDALTHEQHQWYPHTYGGDRVKSVVCEPRVGGQCYEDWGNGAGHSYGTVMHYDPPAAVVLRGGLGGAVVLENAWTLEEDGDVTVVRHSMTAFGDLSDDDVHGIRVHGDLSLFETQLRAWCEEGRPVAR